MRRFAGLFKRITKNGCCNQAITLKIPLTRSAIRDRFKQVIGFTDPGYILGDETSAFEDAAELQIGLGARHGMDYPLHPGEFPQGRVSLRQ
jgi:hypothetical protein